jgi:hypothetical protein
LLALVDEVRTDYEIRKKKEKQESDKIFDYELAEAA